MPEEQGTISKAHLATGRAVDQLRRQLGIVLEQDNNMLLGACPVEGLTPNLFSQLKALPDATLTLLLTAARAHSLGLNDGDGCSVRLDTQSFSLPEILALADPLAAPKNQKKSKKIADKSSLIAEELEKKPVLIENNSRLIGDLQLLHLAKYASLLPALLLVESKDFPENWLKVSAADIAAYWAAPMLDIVTLAAAALPIEGAEQAKLMCFRTRWGTSTHLALIIGVPEKEDTPLVRVHSSCITGDILGSLRCDCGDQLQLALEQIKQAGSGILIYLHQEGRGIGIANKLRAYALQEQGMDTYEANLMLGFDEDERDFALAAGILKKLGVKNIRLMTNNPEKLKALEQAGITVAERVPLVVRSGPHSHGYLEAKAKKSGHLF